MGRSEKDNLNGAEENISRIICGVVAIIVVSLLFRFGKSIRFDLLLILSTTKQRMNDGTREKIRISRIDRANLDQLSSGVLCVYFVFLSFDSFFLRSVVAAVASGRTNANIIEFKSF